MVLDLFKKLDDVSEDVLHPKFKLLRDEITLHAERKMVVSWTEGFEDRDNKIIKEFQTSFHSSLWEFYLYQVFREADFLIDFSQNRPDFIIKRPFEVNVEAVVAEIKQGGPAEGERTLDDILSMTKPLYLEDAFQAIVDESTTRHSNAIGGKARKYVESYSKCDWVKKDTPFVIALGSYAQIKYGREFWYPSLQLLYGFAFDKTTNDYKRVEEIIKPGTSSEIPVALFERPEMKDVSAILFSCSVSLAKLTALVNSSMESSSQLQRVISVWHDSEPPHYKMLHVDRNSPEELSDGLFVFHNPNANVELPEEVFANTNAVQVNLEGRDLKFNGNKCPMVARINFFRGLLPDALLKEFMAEIFLNYNPEYSAN
ncbi:hypothetical protein [Salidesulfovibrio brasiliensis]|uniref:hypothetical protein n=1 Tax=Salidesulfovibrio brasiliensis TaxID=221711 RepID=UPI0006D1FA23|nr:hypothetical protein [Salidesulfovibrio brasiliensis]